VTTPTFDSRRLAAFFLVGLATVALWTALSGTSAEELRLVPCPVRAATGTPCPGCGMTRACVALARGRLGEAWSLHPFAYLLLPLAACVALWPRRTRDAWRRAPAGLRATAVGFALSACLGLWILRLA
jgi:hypothetical protein